MGIRGTIRCTKHGRPLYLQIEGAAVCVKGCYLVLKKSAESRATASQPNSDSVAEGAAFGTRPILGEWTL